MMQCHIFYLIMPLMCFLLYAKNNYLLLIKIIYLLKFRSLFIFIFFKEIVNFIKIMFLKKKNLKFVTKNLRSITNLHKRI